MTPADQDVSIEHVLEVDCPCVACGYNLRGLSGAGRCPECGHSAALSVRGDWLIHSDVRWRRRVALGVRLLAGAMPLLIVLQSLVIYHAVRTVISRNWPPLSVPQPWQELADLLYEAVAPAAVWAATSPRSEAVRRRVPWLVRLFAAGGFCDSILLHTVFRANDSLPHGLLMMCGAMMGAAEVAMFYGYLGTLSRRLPNARLARQFVALGVVYAASRVFGQTLRWGLFLADLGSYRAQTWIAFPATAISLGCKVAAIMLLVRFGRHLQSLEIQRGWAFDSVSND
jgi:hypothetical protein